MRQVKCTIGALVCAEDEKRRPPRWPCETGCIFGCVSRPYRYCECGADLTDAHPSRRTCQECQNRRFLSKRRQCLDCPEDITGSPTQTKRCTQCRDRRSRKEWLIKRLNRPRRYCLDCPKDITDSRRNIKRCDKCDDRRFRKQQLIKRLRRQPHYCLDCSEDISNLAPTAKRCRYCSSEHRYESARRNGERYRLRYVSVIAERDGWVCGRPGGTKGCGRLLFSDVEVHVDHILPRSKGGPDDPSNLQLLCAPCNQWWKDRLEGEARTPVRTVVKSLGGKLDLVTLWLTKKDARVLRRANKASGETSDDLTVEAFLL